jgi:hypothetical protein
MITENQPEQDSAAAGHGRCGEEQHHHDHAHHLAQQIEEKLEHVAEELKEMVAPGINPEFVLQDL